MGLSSELQDGANTHTPSLHALSKQTPRAVPQFPLRSWFEADGKRLARNPAFL